MGRAHVALDLLLRNERGYGVYYDDLHRAGADKRFRDLESLLSGVRLRNEKLVDIYAERLCVHGIECVLRVDERSLSAELLNLGNRMKCDRCFTARLGSVYLDYSPAGKSSDAERHVKRKRSGRDRADVHLRLLAHFHYCAVTEAFFDFRYCGVKRLLFFLRRRIRLKCGVLLLRRLFHTKAYPFKAIIRLFYFINYIIYPLPS